MKIKIMPFLQKKGNRVAKGSIEFTTDILAGFQLIGFTICDDTEKGLYVLFPCAMVTPRGGDETDKKKPYFFLRPSEPGLLEKLETLILDTYDSMVAPGRVSDSK